MIKKTLVAIVAIAVSAPVFAQDSVRKGWALSGSLGSSRIEDKDGQEEFDGNAFGWSVDIEYRFTDYVAVGFGGFSLGEADDMFNGEDTEIKVRGYDLFGRVILPVSDNFELFGRLGAVNYFVDIEPGTVGLDALFGSGAVDLGVGADFITNENLSIRVEGRFFDGDDAESGSLISVGISYLF